MCQVTAQTEEVIRCRVHQRNMATTVEKLQLCIPGASRVPARMMTHCRATGLELNELNVFYALTIHCSAGNVQQTEGAAGIQKVSHTAHWTDFTSY